MTNTDERSRQERKEADLVRSRLMQLKAQPIKGNFDIEHLKAVHTHIFQDLPHRYPGEIRDDTDAWSKNRGLEGHRDSYPVPYLSQNIEKHLSETLKSFGGPDALRNLSKEDAASKLADLYGDLDYGHGFYEGNSRTLREFTRELADAAGHTLDWSRTNEAKESRNQLYLARDNAIYDRAYPNLTYARAMETDSREEYEAFFTKQFLKESTEGKTLRDIMRQALDEPREKPLTPEYKLASEAFEIYLSKNISDAAQRDALREKFHAALIEKQAQNKAINLDRQPSEPDQEQDDDQQKDQDRSR